MKLLPQSSVMRSLGARFRAVAAARLLGGALRMVVCAAAICAAVVCRPAWAARPGDPYASVRLADLGIDTIQPRFLTGTATMFTVHFVDNTHLLVTFNSKGLLARLPDALPGDDDRLVSAVLLELPSGRVLARTQWRTRDREQYLWTLGRGRFLLRVRSKLTVIDPLGNLGTPEPFREMAFLEMQRRIGYVSVSPGGDLLCIETTPPRQPELDDAQAIAAALTAYQNQPRAPGSPQLTLPPKPRVAVEAAGVGNNLVELHFFRMSVAAAQGTKPEHLVAQSAGLLRAPNLVHIPATAEGFLDILQESGGTWLFDFQSHAGKRIELAPFDTSCSPRPYWVSRSEFVSFGCRGSEARVELSGFNMKGEQPWIQILSGTNIATFLATAPDAGRFVFSRILAAGTFYDLQNLTPDDMSSQEVTVLQSYDGRTLFKTQATPIQRTGQNFDISPDGLSFSVFHTDRLDVYHLAALTGKDQESLKLAAGQVPAKTEAMVRLRPIRAGKTGERLPTEPAADEMPMSAPGSTPVTAAMVGVPKPGAAAAPAEPPPTDAVDIVNALSFGGDKPASGAAAPAAATAVRQPAGQRPSDQTPAPPANAAGDPNPDAPRPPPSLYTPEHPRRPNE